MHMHDRHQTCPSIALLSYGSLTPQKIIFLFHAKQGILAFSHDPLMACNQENPNSR